MNILRAKTRGEGGAVAAEFVIIFPLFMAIFLGTFTVGVALYRQVNLTQAAREAARYGATLAPTDGTQEQKGYLPAGFLDEVFDRADEASLGQYEYLCVAYVGPRALDQEDEVITASKRTDGSGDECFDDGLTGRRIQVHIVTTSDFWSFYNRGILTPTGRSVARYEAIRFPDP